MFFSPKQQHVLLVVFLLYGLWLFGFVSTDMQRTIEGQPIQESDLPGLLFYIDPPLDVNTADVEELQLLPGIGEILSKRIIAYREQYGKFHSLEALRQIKGIGPKTVQKLQPYVNLPETP